MILALGVFHTINSQRRILDQSSLRSMPRLLKTFPCSNAYPIQPPPSDHFSSPNPSILLIAKSWLAFPCMSLICPNDLKTAGRSQERCWVITLASSVRTVGQRSLRGLKKRGTCLITCAVVAERVDVHALPSMP